MSGPSDMVSSPPNSELMYCESDEIAAPLVY